MRTNKVIQFVCFETTLATDQFLSRWEQFSHSDKTLANVTLQQCDKKNSFIYIAQHHCDSGDMQFFFTRSRKPSRTPEVEIKTKQAGGYALLEAKKLAESQSGMKKVFAFISDPTTDLSVFRQLTAYSQLNIFEAYYENCQYAYILEYFVKDKYAEVLQEQLKQYEVAGNIFKECLIPVA